MEPESDSASPERRTEAERRRPDSSETSPHPDHTGMDHPSMDHMDHGSMDQMDHGPMAHMDHPSMDHMDHGSMDQMDHGPMAHMDHGDMGHMDHGDMGHMDHGDMGHMDHGDMVGQFRRLFWIMVVLAIPTLLFNHMFAGLVGYQLPEVNWLHWISPVLGTVIYFWGGRPFLTGAVGELRSRRPGMMMLISLAITVAFFASWGASLGLLSADLDVWWELALLVVIMLLGHWIEMRSLGRASSALDSLARLLPDEAEIITADGTRTVAVDQLQVGDLLLIRPGSAIPTDAIVTEGSAQVDESMITGESRPVTRGVGDQVVGGTVVTDSGLRVRVSAVGDETALAGIERLVAKAQQSTSRTQRLADRAAGWLFWFALGAAAITAVVWSLVGSPDDAVVRTISVLVIACPHALGLAIPLVVAIATERAARSGILIADRLALENMRNVDTVVFDKTGTLTKGNPNVDRIIPQPGWDTDEVIRLAAAAESDSEHPLGRAIIAAATDRHLQVPTSSDFSSAAALGVRATVAGRTVEVGGPALLRRHGADRSAADDHRVDLSDGDSRTARAGATVLHVFADQQLIGSLELTDEVRPESAQAVAQLRAVGIEPVMITGDAKEIAEAVGREVGIDQVMAEVRPEDKASEVASLQAAGRRVAMVGDGVNDAPALAGADVGIAIGAGTDVAIASAGLILTGSDPRAVVTAVNLSKATYRKMRQNLWWAAGYNLLSVPLAAGVLAPVGFVLPMSVGALLMSASTVIVALNAQLLRRE
ncbi:heavy metal translocating P-type ATPase [Naumannella halotolerans]|uniref:Cu2+-exporting ATPase n=1 Tax=Naumannella halotolerans TaxID=993414 RepID=A0A4R7J847_9ACTN|nr:heavy metal translocating P-type ATPase [Naumannella halotolerans]TDT32946.1 Cu2+-exporting ATPase [Naumannella halotolerans]